MIYEFKCRATGNLVMTEPVGSCLLTTIGKQPGPQGLIAVDQMPAAIARLHAAVEHDRRLAQRTATEGGASASAGKGDDNEPPEQISLGQRAFPFIEMLEAALAAKRDITWGV